VARKELVSAGDADCPEEWVAAFLDKETHLAFGCDKDRLPVYRAIGSQKRISILVPAKEVAD